MLELFLTYFDGTAQNKSVGSTLYKLQLKLILQKVIFLLASLDISVTEKGKQN